MWLKVRPALLRELRLEQARLEALLREIQVLLDQPDITVPGVTGELNCPHCAGTFAVNVAADGEVEIQEAGLRESVASCEAEKR